MKNKKLLPPLNGRKIQQGKLVLPPHQKFWCGGLAAGFIVYCLLFTPLDKFFLKHFCSNIYLHFTKVIKFLGSILNFGC